MMFEKLLAHESYSIMVNNIPRKHKVKRSTFGISYLCVACYIILEKEGIRNTSLDYKTSKQFGSDF